MTFAGAVIVLVVASILFIGSAIDKSNFDYEYAIQANINLARLYNNSIAGNNLVTPWLPIENTVRNLNEILTKYGWYKGDYRLLLTWTDIGDFNIFTNAKKALIIEEIGDLISIKGNSGFHFMLQDYLRVLKAYFLLSLTLLIIFFNKKTLFFFLLYLCLFYILICVLNMFFRSLPFRLWANIVNLFIILFLFQIKINSMSLISKLNLYENKY